MNRSPVYTALAAAVLFLILVPLGTSVFILGFIHGDSPCILCWAQRIGMAIVALIGLFILRYGPRPRYVGLGVLVGAWGVFMAVRHSSLHLARDIGQGFAIEMLGAHTYVWSFAVFWVCIIVMALMLMKVPVEDLQVKGTRPLRVVDSVAMLAFMLVAAGTMVQAFASTGPPPFVGQSDPVRFSFNPRHWVWSLDEFSSAPISFRGRWAVDRPDISTLDPNPAGSPLRNLPQLTPATRRSLALELNGSPTGLAYDRGSDRFLLTTEHGIYLVDGTLNTVTRHTVVDPLFSVDLGKFAGAAFLDRGRLLAVTENKSFVVLRESTKADANRNYRFFLESAEAFDEVSRSRFATVRARMMYVMSATTEPELRTVTLVSVPNVKSRRWVISRFDTSDMMLSEEFVPRMDPAVSPDSANGSNPLEAFTVTATAIDGGKLYALSAAHSTLLTIDLASHTVTAAHTIPGLAQPTGMALKGDRLIIVSRDGTVTEVEKL